MTHHILIGCGMLRTSFYKTNKLLQKKHYFRRYIFRIISDNDDQFRRLLQNRRFFVVRYAVFLWTMRCGGGGVIGGVRVFCLQIMAAARMMARNVGERVKRVMLRDV